MAFKDKGIIKESVYLDERDCELILNSLYEWITARCGCERDSDFDKLVNIFSEVLNAKESIVRDSLNK